MKFSFFLAATSVWLSAVLFGAGVVTPFVAVDMGIIPEGQSVTVHGPGGTSILLFNKEDQAVHVQMKAQGVPDAEWIHFFPPEVTLLPHQNVLIKMEVNVPKKKEFRGRAYEALILTRMASKNPSRVEIVGVLQSRLRFRVE